MSSLAIFFAGAFCGSGITFLAMILVAVSDDE